jgi:hypothetical protein
MQYDDYGDEVDLLTLKGKVITDVVGLKVSSDEVLIEFSDGTQVKMFHVQGCCESVYIEDVCGDVNDLIGSTIVHFEERTNEGDTEWGSFTHTFYDIQTTKGCVNIRWNGESNGYYSESVEIIAGKPWH